MQHLPLHSYPYHHHAMPERVGFGRRVLAALVDNVLIGFLALGLTFAFGSSLTRFVGAEAPEFSIFSDNTDDDAEQQGEQQNDEYSAAERLLGMPEKTFQTLVLANAITTAFYSLVELFTAASLGKRIMGIIIAADAGNSASRSLLFKRWLMKYAGYIIVLIPMLATLGSIWSFMINCGFLLTLGSSRQALHDMAVHSAVYFKEDFLYFNEQE